MVTHEVTDSVVRVRGTRRVVARADGHELESAAVDETFRLDELAALP
jgi:hypothetical protein